MNNLIPVVLIHRFNVKPQKTDYAAQAIKQSVFFENPTFSITDYTPVADNLSNHTNLSFEEYITGEYMAFNQNYVLLNTNPFEYERLNIGRFFILQEFMLKHNFKKIFHIDSDVLLYTKIQDHAQKFSTDFTLSNSQHIANSFLTIKFVQDFCKKMLKVYEDRESNFWFKDMQKIYERMAKEGRRGGITDMSYLEQYKKRSVCNDLNLTCGEMTEVIDNQTFDFSIKHDVGSYRMKDGLKDIFFNEKVPFCFNEALQKNVQFLSLHFLGNTKEILEKYITHSW